MAKGGRKLLEKEVKVWRENRTKRTNVPVVDLRLTYEGLKRLIKDTTERPLRQGLGQPSHTAPMS